MIIMLNSFFQVGLTTFYLVFCFHYTVATILANLKQDNIIFPFLARPIKTTIKNYQLKVTEAQAQKIPNNVSNVVSSFKILRPRDLVILVRNSGTE